MPAQTRFANAHGHNNYFGTRAEQDSHSRVAPRGLLAGCFGCGAVSRHDADVPDAKRHSSIISSDRDSPTPESSTAAASAGRLGAEANESPGASTALDTGGQRLSSTALHTSPGSPGSGLTNSSNAWKATPAAAVAPEPPSSGAATPRAPAPSGPSASASALTDVFSNWRKPKVRTSEVTPIDDTADEVSPSPAPASSAPSAAGSRAGLRSPRPSDAAGAAAGASAAAAEGDAAGSAAGSGRTTPTAGQRRTPAADGGGGALAQRLIAGLAEQHPGMVTVASFKDSESSSQAPVPPRTSVTATPTSGTATAAQADGAQGGGAAAAAASGGDAITAALVGSEPRPTFLRRGASCSGAEPPGAGFLIAAAGAPSPLGVRGSMARRSSYAGDGSAVGLFESHPQPQLSPSPLRPSPSLRPTPPSPPPAAQPQPLLQPSPSQRPSALPLLQPSPSLRPAPLLGPNAPSLLLQSPSLLRQPAGPPGQQKLLLPSPSLLHTNDPAVGGGGAAAGGGGDEHQLRLPPPQPAHPMPMLLHNGCSFSRNVTTGTAVSALGALRPLGSMPRHGTLAPIASVPSAEEKASALNRLASLQMMHRQKQQQQQLQQGAQAAVQPSPAAPPEPKAPQQEAAAAAPAAAFSAEAKPPAARQPDPNVESPGERDGDEDCDSEADSVVGDLRPPPAPRMPPGGAGSGSAAQGGPLNGHGPGNLRATESMQPMRRAASDEPIMASRAAGAGAGPADLARTLALSDTGGAAGTGPVAADPRVPHGSHAARWLDSLQPPATAERVRGPEPIEPIPEPEISASSLASSAAPDRRSSASAVLVPPPQQQRLQGAAAGRVAALRADDKPAPGAVDSFKCLLQEIEP